MSNVGEVSTIRLHTAEWHAALGELFDNVGKTDFPYMLAGIINRIAPYNSTAIYAFADKKEPQLLFHDIPATLVDVTLTKYVEGPYLLDPIVQACMRGHPSGAYHLSELAPDHFTQSEYYKRYYRSTGLLDESVLLIRLDSSLYIAASFGHRDPYRGKISGRSLRKLKVAAPLLMSFARKHWEPILSAASADHTENVLSKAFESFGHEILTKREQQITREILKGHSGKSIARTLNISVETVKVHRKHINSKLNVSSHAQLFTAFIEHLTQGDATPSLSLVDSR